MVSVSPIWQLGHVGHLCFYHAAVTEPLVRDLIVAKVSPHTLQNWFLFNHTTLFSTKGLEKSLYDFTGTIFTAWVNPYITLLKLAKDGPKTPHEPLVQSKANWTFKWNISRSPPTLPV